MVFRVKCRCAGTELKRNHVLNKRGTQQVCICRNSIGIWCCFILCCLFPPRASSLWQRQIELWWNTFPVLIHIYMCLCADRSLKENFPLFWYVCLFGFIFKFTCSKVIFLVYGSMSFDKCIVIWLPSQSRYRAVLSPAKFLQLSFCRQPFLPFSTPGNHWVVVHCYIFAFSRMSYMVFESGLLVHLARWIWD